MFFCVECGRLIEEHQIEKWTEPHGEQMEGCPYCHGVLEKAHKCHICGEYFCEEDLMSGICEDCAKNNFEYETALKYLVETSRLREFFLVWLWGIVDSIDAEKECKEIDRTLMAIFRHEEAENPESFKKTLQEYILEDIYDWTDFLRKEASANENGKD